jgi:hypothetical protein
MLISRALQANRVQTPLMVWFTQFLGGRTGVDEHYMRYTYEQAPRTYPKRIAPPSKNEKLHSKHYHSFLSSATITYPESPP